MHNRATITILIVFISMIARAEDLHRFSLDHAYVASPKIESDSQIKMEGENSLKISTNSGTIVNIGQLGPLSVENHTLVYTAKVKSDLEGRAYLEMWVTVDGRRYFSRGLNSTVGQQSGWKTIQTPFIFQKGQSPEKVELNIVIQGHGTVWVDDVRILKEPL